MNIDGLTLRMTCDFLKDLENRGLSSSKIRLKFLARDANIESTSIITYQNYSVFFKRWENILKSSKFLCSSGPFVIVQNIHLSNKNLKFLNEYQCYNITQDRYLVKNIKYDKDRLPFYESEIQRYLIIINQLMDDYKNNIDKAIIKRSEPYVDPCYVDAGYIYDSSADNIQLEEICDKPPIIEVQPNTPLDICPDGTTNNISFLANGFGNELSYQWQYWNGSAWVNVAFFVPTGATYNGENSSTAFNATIEDPGTYDYSCLVTSCAGEVRTDTITVTVVENPSITVQPAANTPPPVLVNEQTAPMSVTAIGGTPELYYQWQYFNGVSWVNAVDGVPSGAIYEGANTGDSFKVTHSNTGSYPYSCFINSGVSCSPVRSGAVIVEVTNE